MISRIRIAVEQLYLVDMVNVKRSFLSAQSTSPFIASKRASLSFLPVISVCGFMFPSAPVRIIFPGYTSTSRNSCTFPRAIIAPAVFYLGWLYFVCFSACKAFFLDFLGPTLESAPAATELSFPISPCNKNLSAIFAYTFTFILWIGLLTPTNTFSTFLGAIFRRYIKKITKLFSTRFAFCDSWIFTRHLFSKTQQPNKIQNTTSWNSWAVCDKNYNIYSEHLSKKWYFELYHTSTPGPLPTLP